MRQILGLIVLLTSLACAGGPSSAPDGASDAVLLDRAKRLPARSVVVTRQGKKRVIQEVCNHSMALTVTVDGDSAVLVADWHEGASHTPRYRITGVEPKGEGWLVSGEAEEHGERYTTRLAWAPAKAQGFGVWTDLDEDRTFQVATGKKADGLERRPPTRDCSGGQ